MECPMSAMFSNVFIIVLLQVVVILFSFFLPEILFRITKKQESWHVLLASFFMIFAVIFLTLLHSSTAMEPDKQEDRQPQTASAAAPEYTLRIGPLSQRIGSPLDVQLTVFNNGPVNDFNCSLDFLDKNSAKPLGEADFELISEKDVLHLESGANGICSWNVVFHKTGEVLADAFVQGSGLEPSNHEQIALQIAPAEKKEQQAEAVQAPSAAVSAVSTVALTDATVWIYYTRDESTDSNLVKKLKSEKFKHAVAKGVWKTRSESQFLFHRTPEGNDVTELRKALGLEDVEVYYFDERRVGNKIKQTFKDNPELDYLVIAR